MRHCSVSLILLMLSLAATAEEQLPVELTPDQEVHANRSAESTGLAIYRHDRAATVATDAIRTLRVFRKDKRLRGWITEDLGSEIVVTFIGAPSGQPTAALYRVHVSEDGKVAGNPVALEAPAPLTPFEAAASASRASAVASGFEPCSVKYNTVVLPLDNNGVRHWIVYLIPGTTKDEVVPIGGTYRIEVDSDGQSIVAKRPFTRTCITLPKDETSVALTITHLLDSTPTEAHVFWSLWSGLPFYVLTPPHGTVWSIEGGKIKLVERRAQTGEPTRP